MSDSAPEPTMEEILASIRRIISEDEAPAADKDTTAVSPEPVMAAAVAPPPVAPKLEAVPSPPPPAPVHAPPPIAAAPRPTPQDDVLELTQRVEPSPAPAPTRFAAAESLGDLDFASDPVAMAPAPPPEPTFTRAPPPQPPAPRVLAPEEGLVSGHAADRAAGHFGALAQSILMPAPGRTLEDLVREMMRPMLKEWLDQHLSGIVEAAVQSEVDRISRARRY